MPTRGDNALTRWKREWIRMLSSAGVSEEMRVVAGLARCRFELE
ncbi:MAG TPA: hypothetical protein VHF67_06305 [Gaiellaceae bacterium]|jgi:hypothetical protein|nr:hypothetical protein [Gaiellaceae bacterium]